MRKKVFIIIDVVLGLILLGVLIYGILYFTKPDNIKFKNEYEALNKENVVVLIPKDNPIKYVEINEIFDILENKTGVVYFGFPSCPWCRNMLPILFESAKNNEYDTIYYFNPSDIRNNDNGDYSKLIQILDEYLQESETGEKRLYVPDVYFVKEGTIVGHHLGTVDSQDNPYEAMNQEQKEELATIFNDLFSLIK